MRRFLFYLPLVFAFGNAHAGDCGLNLRAVLRAGVIDVRPVDASEPLGMDSKARRVLIDTSAVLGDRDVVVPPVNASVERLIPGTQFSIEQFARALAKAKDLALLDRPENTQPRRLAAITVDDVRVVEINGLPDVHALALLPAASTRRLVIVLGPLADVDAMSLLSRGLPLLAVDGELNVVAPGGEEPALFKELTARVAAYGIGVVALDLSALGGVGLSVRFD